jgi:membrane protein implicated in regulation of membrane protease activity
MLTAIEFINNPIFGIIFWLVIFIIALVIELALPELISIWFCGSSLIALILAIFNVPFIYQASVFVVLSAVLLSMSRIFLRKLVLNKKIIPTNADALIGKEIRLTSDCSKEQSGEGIVRDVPWKVIVNDDAIFVKGEKAIVQEIKGNRLIIKKLEKEGK